MFFFVFLSSICREEPRLDPGTHVLWRGSDCQTTSDDFSTSGLPVIWPELCSKTLADEKPHNQSKFLERCFLANANYLDFLTSPTPNAKAYSSPDGLIAYSPSSKGALVVSAKQPLSAGSTEIGISDSDSVDLAPPIHILILVIVTSREFLVDCNLYSLYRVGSALHRRNLNVCATGRRTSACVPFNFAENLA
jgi:hypothetical protein